MIRDYILALKREFSGYGGSKLGKDILAGITTAAVALPLALAFGVSSGADAAAGLITAIIAGVLIGALSGASFQISGPTGAMAAILVPLVAQHGLEGIFVAGLLSGIILLLCGLFKLGGLVSFIPSPVITGFTSGIAIIIALGQIDNLSGLSSAGETTLHKVISYFHTPQSVDWVSLGIGLAVIGFMMLYPKNLARYFPGSLASIILAVVTKMFFSLDVAAVGEIPRTLLLDNRLHLARLSFSEIPEYIIPAISIAALGLIESLLCGASAGRMKNERLDANRELVAQGIGNIVIPFFGGVPATAAIARTSVAIKSGAQTRLAGIIHAITLLASMFLLAPVMSEIPLAALSGVLIVTAWRMNEWHSIKNIFNRRIKTAMAQFLITMAATVVFDLTVAILAGVGFSIIAFVVKTSSIEIEVCGVDSGRLTDDVADICHEETCVAYITGPLYFGSAGRLEQQLAGCGEKRNVILSMRGVPLADISGVNALQELYQRLEQNGTSVYFACVHPSVTKMFERCGLCDHVPESRFFWSTDKALAYIAHAQSHAVSE